MDMAQGLLAGRGAAAKLQMLMQCLTPEMDNFDASRAY
jgi:hypothetical protein